MSRVMYITLVPREGNEKLRHYLDAKACVLHTSSDWL